MSFLGKTYTLDRNEGLDDLMKAYGFSDEIRQKALNGKATTTISESGGTYTLAITSPIKNQTLTFKLGEEFEETALSGRKTKTTFTRDGNRVTCVQKGEKRITTTTRDFTDSDMKQVLSLSPDGKNCTLYFKA